MRKIFKITIIVFFSLTLIFSSLLVFQYFRLKSVEFEWLEGEPEDYGFKWNYLASSYLEAEDMPYLRSVLIVRYGTLLAEWYFNDGSRDAAYTIMSASKSFMSALIGIAFREGYLTDLDQKILDYFPEYVTPELDSRKHNITIRHLLQMKAGFNFNDTAEDWIVYSGSLDWGKYAIELPLLHNPGEGWHYSTVQSNLLSIILSKASNMTTREFAEQFLFDPLNITIAQWYQDPQGYYTGGHEMYFTPRNLVNFGLLYLNNGSFEGEQIVPSEWVQESIQDYSEGEVENDIALSGGSKSDFYIGTGYGYQWWIKTMRNFDSFSARGLGGQFIVCFPELDMVVITTATGSLLDTYPGQFEGMLNLIENNILKSIKN